jgi:NAD(P)H-dependent flavin oxidoreductase YrpB (nitropropane dioxygenase family)
MVHAAGALVMYTVPSAAAARRAVEAGVDIIVAQVWEAGGHVRRAVATLALVPRVVAAGGRSWRWGQQGPGSAHGL